MASGNAGGSGESASLQTAFVHHLGDSFVCYLNAPTTT